MCMYMCYEIAYFEKLINTRHLSRGEIYELKRERELNHVENKVVAILLL